MKGGYDLWREDMTRGTCEAVTSAPIHRPKPLVYLLLNQVTGINIRRNVYIQTQASCHSPQHRTMEEVAILGEGKFPNLMDGNYRSSKEPV